MMRRPSENLPLGRWKYVSPYGGVGATREAAKPPVSEFESPKLKMAGKSQPFEANTGFSTVVAIDKTTKNDICGLWNFVAAGYSIGDINPAKHIGLTIKVFGLGSLYGVTRRTFPMCTKNVSHRRTRFQIIFCHKILPLPTCWLLISDKYTGAYFDTSFLWKSTVWLKSYILV